MFEKTCPFCKDNSYSAAGRGQWICPYCGADLTGIVPRLACGEDKVEEKPKNKNEIKVIHLYDHVKDKGVLGGKVKF